MYQHLALWDATTTNDWSWIRKLGLPQKIRTFIWQVLHERIHTQDLRHRWGLTSINICAHCKEHPEATLHVLRDCRFSQRVWRSIVPLRQHDGFFLTSVNVWIKITSMASLMLIGAAFLGIVSEAFL